MNLSRVIPFLHKVHHFEGNTLRSFAAKTDDSNTEEEITEPLYQTTSSMSNSRRTFLSSLVLSSVGLTGKVNSANAEEESFQSIAAKAASIAKNVEAEEAKSSQEANAISTDPRTVYDFELPVAGKPTSFTDLVRQEYYTVNTEKTDSEGNAVVETKMEPKVKAILVVNIKQDDPIARKNIPELISLAAKFGRNGEFAVVVSPTDQGYYEPDTSALLRLKLASEYGYGINPACVLTDKVNLLGTGAHPFWRWIEGTCRTPAGLGKIQANFEKFLVDGRTGKPIRRYPRKYQPFDIAEDIDATIKGKPLLLAGANWKEEWRNAAKEAETDTYRFQKGLNVFDQ